MMRTVLSLLAFLSVLWFPYPVTLVLSFVASLLLPPVGVLVGVFADVLYWTPSFTIPVATLSGIGISLAGLFVRRFIKARIIRA